MAKERLPWYQAKVEPDTRIRRPELRSPKQEEEIKKAVAASKVRILAKRQRFIDLLKKELQSKKLTDCQRAALEQALKEAESNA